MITVDQKTQPEVIKTQTKITQKKSHIIIIEDEPQISSTMELFLKLNLKPYFELKFFNNAEEAFNYICENIADVELIITDHLLPGMSGMQLLSMLKKDVTLRHLHVIVQTCESLNDLTAYKARPDFYLQKPWTKQQMMDAIQKALGINLQ